MVTWQVKNVISLLSQGLWIPNLAGWWIRMRRPYCKVTWHINHVVRWQIKNAISPLSQGLWPQNMLGRWVRMRNLRGGSRDFEKRGLYVGHHGWPMKKFLGCRWSKKAKITLETKDFWQNISFNIFKFSPFSYIMKACRWNLINFSKFTNAFRRKEKKRVFYKAL